MTTRKPPAKKAAAKKAPARKPAAKKAAAKRPSAKRTAARGASAGARSPAKSATARPPSKPRGGLYVVGEDETPPDESTEPKKRAMKVAAAAAGGDQRELFVALAAKIADTIDAPNTPARDLAALSRRLLEIQREIKALDADEDDDEVGEAARTPDGEFDPAAI